MLTNHAIANARFHRRLYRICTLLGIKGLDDKHAELAARWREVA